MTGTGRSVDPIDPVPAAPGGIGERRYDLHHERLGKTAEDILSGLQIVGTLGDIIIVFVDDDPCPLQVAEPATPAFRDGRVAAQVIKRADAGTIGRFLDRFVSQNAVILSDDTAIGRAAKAFSGHETVAHRDHNYADGEVHSNTAEKPGVCPEEGAVRCVPLPEPAPSPAVRR